jgi:membrane-anchored glycerophosphoryl diester phosphodiesterase (GDPDase)
MLKPRFSFRITQRNVTYLLIDISFILLIVMFIIQIIHGNHYTYVIQVK